MKSLSLAALGAALLFSSAARAEAGVAPPPSCSLPDLTACGSDAGESTMCTRPNGDPGKCLPTLCRDLDDAGNYGDTHRVFQCAYVDVCPTTGPCDGKAEGDECTTGATASSGPTSRTVCKRYDNYCYGLVDGSLGLSSYVQCVAETLPTQSTEDGGPRIIDTNPETPNDGGCSAAPSTPFDAMLLLASPVAFALMAARKRSRRLRARA